MKDIEKICGSSLDQFLILDNNNATGIDRITFLVKGYSPCNIIIKDIDNTAWEGITLQGANGNSISETTFNTKTNQIQTGLSLLECLKQNSLFYGYKTPQIIGNNMLITCSINSGKNYSITTSNSNQIEIATTSNNNSINKFVVDIDIKHNGVESNLILDKLTTDSTVSFNMTAPFSYATTKYPYECNIFAYTTDTNIASLIQLNNYQYYVLPTTLLKFDYINLYDKYFKDNLNPVVKPFLTTNFNKRINYNELIVMSFLTDSVNTSIRKRYYTNSGRFLKQEDGYTKTETSLIRTDYYDIPNIEGVETNYNTQVGYIIYNVINSSGQFISEDMRYNVIPSCNPNREIFFVNEVGGLESFNFLADNETDYSVDNLTTFSVTPLKPFTDVKMINQVKTKTQDVTYTYKSDLIDEETASWLNQLNKAKYTWVYDKDNIENIIIIETFDINIVNDTKVYELQVEWIRSDNKIKF